MEQIQRTTTLQTLTISGEPFYLETFASAETARETLCNEAAAIFDIFLQRETEFGVNPSVTIDYPDLDDKSASGFLSDAAAYVRRRVAAIAIVPAVSRIVVLTTYSDLVWPSFEAAGYHPTVIDMPAGPEHTAAFILESGRPDSCGRTLYIEAVNEQDEKIRPSFVLKLSAASGRLIGGACGAISERDGNRYAYLATLALASEAPSGMGTALVDQLVHFLRQQQVVAVHLGTQTAGSFYEKNGFHVDHRLITDLRVRQHNGQTIFGDLVMLSRVL